jgi:hypothetical protein
VKLPQLIPPKDLLERVQGVEKGLKTGKNVEKAGWGAFVISAGTVVVSVVKTGEAIPGLKNNPEALWPVIIAAAAIVLIVLLINWTRVWVRSSRKSFRYTYSIVPFKAIPGSEELPRSPAPADATGWTDETDVGGEPTDDATDESAQPTDEGTEEMSETAESETGETEEAPTDDEAMTREYSEGGEDPYTDGSAGGATPLAWFVQDLTDRLSRRIGRLSWLAEGLSDETTAKSHIHIEGTYGVRENAQGVWNVEVLPRVRIGRKTDPETVAHLVTFTLDPGQTLTPEAYEKLLERLYFSVASHLYAQIRVDVSRKINLLPKRYFRASAYFHEAADYARSNTLDAY